jgi:hypothetical protein
VVAWDTQSVQRLGVFENIFTHFSTTH